jgi:hypothetical protein
MAGGVEVQRQMCQAPKIDWSKAGAKATVAALVGLAAFLIPMPEQATPLFRLVALVGGIGGYWVAENVSVASVKFLWRLVWFVVSVILAAVGSLFLFWYFGQTYTGYWFDLLAFVDFGLIFGIACILLGLLKIAPT